MHLAVGDTIRDRLAAGGLVKTLIDSGATPRQIIERLFVQTLSRQPTSEELADFGELVAGNEKDPAAYEDILWGLLNSTEFVFNH